MDLWLPGNALFQLFSQFSLIFPAGPEVDPTGSGIYKARPRDQKEFPAVYAFHHTSRRFRGTYELYSLKKP